MEGLGPDPHGDGQGVRLSGAGRQGAVPSAGRASLRPLPCQWPPAMAGTAGPGLCRRRSVPPAGSSEADSRQRTRSAGRQSASWASALLHRHSNAGAGVQVRYLTRIVTPEDYDAAARLRPETCPMYYMGDRRSGRQVPRLHAHARVYTRARARMATIATFHPICSPWIPPARIANGRKRMCRGCGLRDVFTVPASASPHGRNWGHCKIQNAPTWACR